MRMSRGRKKLKVRVPKNPGIPEYHKTQESAEQIAVSHGTEEIICGGESSLFYDLF